MPRLTVMERFWRKTRVEGDCIVWIGAKTHGYGVFAPIGTKTYQTHRWLYQQALGELPSNVDVMHSCDNRPCVRLQHLSSGSRQANMQDASAKGRTCRGEARANAKLTEAQVVELRERHAAGESLAVLAAVFDLGVMVVHRIVTGQSWAHAGGPIRPKKPRSGM